VRADVEALAASDGAGLIAVADGLRGLGLSAAGTLEEMATLLQQMAVLQVVPEAADALFVIYPKRQGFGLEAVPRELGSFANRLDLPASWGGLEGAELVAATGVEEAVFCHAKRFLAVARSRAGIKRLAELVQERTVEARV